MSNRKALAKLLRSALPAEQRSRNLQQLGLWIAPENLQEVRTLLAVGPTEWTRSYPPNAAIAGEVQEVLVGCFGGLLRVAFKPL